jgi:general secretion pathway protein A
VDRISLKCTLEPLDLPEAREMIAFRLQAAGYRSRVPLFSEDAIEEIYEYTEGYPRRIAMLCHQALRHLVMRNGRSVDQLLVEELIHGEIETGWSPSKRLLKSNY